MPSRKTEKPINLSNVGKTRATINTGIFFTFGLTMGILANIMYSRNQILLCLLVN